MTDSAIARDIEENRLLEAVADHGGDKPALVNDRPGSGAFVQSFQSLVDHWVGYLVLVTHESENGGNRISNSAAVRVDNVSEVVRVLEVLFKR